MLEFIASTVTVASPLVSLILGALGLAALVCWILEIVAAFQKGDGPLMGILSIVLCSLGGFIIGWIHNKKWGIQKVMLIWTILVVVMLIANIAFGLAIAGASELQGR